MMKSGYFVLKVIGIMHLLVVFTGCALNKEINRVNTGSIILNLTIYDANSLDTLSGAKVHVFVEGEILLDTFYYESTSSTIISTHPSANTYLLVAEKEGYQSDTIIFTIEDVIVRNQIINKNIYFVSHKTEVELLFYDNKTLMPVEGVNIRLSREGFDENYVYSLENSISIELDEDAIYQMEVSKEGYVSSLMTIETFLPDENSIVRKVFLESVELSMDLSLFEDIGLLSFDLPPPATEKIMSIKDVNQLMPESQTLGDLDSIMRTRLEDAGFKDKYDYFKIVQDREIRAGIVYVTDFERIEETGEVAADRWNYEIEKSSSRNWLGIRKVGKGYFRFFAFVFYEGSFGTTDFNRERDRFSEVFTRYMQGASTGFPDQLREVEYDDELNLYILIYEYFQRSNEEDGTYNVLDITPETHLRSAGLSYFIDH